MIKNKNITLAIILCSLGYFTAQAQTMKNYSCKELLAKVGDIYMETPDENPCAGSEIYLILKFNKQEVTLSEKEVSSCDEESITPIGTYPWNLLHNHKIEVDFIADQIKGTYAEQLKLELRDQQIIGSITHVNGKTKEYVFQEEM